MIDRKKMSDIVDCKRKVSSKKKCFPRKVFGDEGASNEELEQEETNNEKKKKKNGAEKQKLQFWKIKAKRKIELEEEAKV